MDMCQFVIIYPGLVFDRPIELGMAPLIRTPPMIQWSGWRMYRFGDGGTGAVNVYIWYSAIQLMVFERFRG